MTSMVRDILAIVLWPLIIPYWLMVAFYAWLYWPCSTKLTGRPIRMVSLSAGMSPFERGKEALASYYRINSRWPESFAELDPYGIMEFTSITSMYWSIREDGTLDLRMFIKSGKGRFTIQPPVD